MAQIITKEDKSANLRFVAAVKADLSEDAKGSPLYWLSVDGVYDVTNSRMDANQKKMKLLQEKMNKRNLVYH